MSPSTARSLRSALGLPRVPKDMTRAQRMAYRSIKRRYLALPAPARALFKANVNLLRDTVAAI